MRQRNGQRILFCIFFISLMALWVVPSFTLAQEERERRDLRPERGIAVYPEYSGVTVSKGETVRLDLTLENQGRKDETIDVTISKIPKEWKASLKGGSYMVSGMYVPNGKTRTLGLTLEPEKTVGIGTYQFQIDGKTGDGKLTSSQTLTVSVKPRAQVAEDIQLTTSYPVLRGQPDAKFEFSVEVTNKSENDRTFNLSAVGPEKWEMNFKPSYETKQISSLRIKGGQSQAVAVEVTPLKDAAAGQYPKAGAAGSPRWLNGAPAGWDGWPRLAFEPACALDFS